MSSESYRFLLDTNLTPSQELLESLSHLASEHYGQWSAQAPFKANENISFPPFVMQKFFMSGKASLSSAYDGDLLIGQAIAQTFSFLSSETHKEEKISWTTQLVVHKDYRRRKIAQKLLQNLWKNEDYFARGFATAGPYAVRSLEKATGLRCIPALIARHLPILKKQAFPHIWYIGTEAETHVSVTYSEINTRFYASHAKLAIRLKNVTTPQNPWLLGPLQEGWEWLAFTFR